MTLGGTDINASSTPHEAGSFAIGVSHFGEDVPADACYYSKRSGLEMHNVHQLLYQKASYEAVAESMSHRGLVNTRSGTAGMQRYPICWSGDPNRGWEDMLNHIHWQVLNEDEKPLNL